MVLETYTAVQQAADSCLSPFSRDYLLLLTAHSRVASMMASHASLLSTAIMCQGLTLMPLHLPQLLV